VDIDDLIDNVDDVKDALKNDPYSEAVFYSVGAKGLAVAVKIDGRKHVDSYIALEKYYLQTYGLKVDPSCKNVARLRYVTSDPDIFINYDSLMFTCPEETKEDVFISDDYQPLPAYDPSKQGAHTVQDEIIRRSLALIDSAVVGGVHHAIMKAAFLAGGYIAGGLCEEQAVKDAMLMAIMQKPNALSRKEEEKKVDDGIRAGKAEPCNELKVDETKSKEPRQFEFIKWYELSKPEKIKHSNMIAEIREQHREGNEITNDFMVMACKNYGYDLNVYSLIKNEIWEKEKVFFGFSKKNNLQRIQILIEDKYDLRDNVIRDRVEMYKDGELLPLKSIKSHIYIDLSLQGHKFSASDVKEYLDSGKVRSYHPFKEYFDNLEEYDGTDHIKALCSYIKTDDDDFFYSMVKKHLVRSVGCATDNRYVNRHVMVLSSQKQSIGKSVFIRNLNPFNGKYITEAGIKSGGQEKDTAIAMTKNFIYNIDELENVFRRNLERFKSLVSMEVVSERGAYQANETDRARVCSFWGSTNKSEYLEDDSNTRWLNFTINDIDWNYSKDVDIHKVWSQASYLYKQGGNDSLTSEEKKIQEERNKNYEDVTTEEQIIKKYAEPSLNFIPLIDIIEHLKTYSPAFDVKNNRSIGRLITKLGYTKKRATINGQKHTVYGCNLLQKDIAIKRSREIQEIPENKPVVRMDTKKLF